MRSKINHYDAATPRKSAPRGARQCHTEGVKRSIPTEAADRQPALTRAEARVQLYARQDPLAFATSTAVEIAEASSTSDATVARTARKLGFHGVREWKRVCADSVDSTLGLDALLRVRLDNLSKAKSVKSSGGLARQVLASSAEALLALAEILESSALDHGVDELVNARRVLVYGLGAAYHVAEYLSLALERVGVDARAVTGSGHTLADAIPRLRSDDVSIVLAPRLLFPDIVWYAAESAQRCAATILVTTEPAPERLRQSTITLRLPSTAQVVADDTILTLALADVFVAAIARQEPNRSLATRQAVQMFRDRIYSGQRCDSR
ncbi:MurR/RpiR family transcriptional regulator [Brevibacterium sp. S111]|nr:MurR/RpiR family transcriptional regulator [Brevibacterium sp. S111]